MGLTRLRICLATALLSAVFAADPANADPVTETVGNQSCAALSGDPWGLQFGNPGSVKFQDMNSAAAITQCRAELGENSGEPRLSYYLGRALYAAKLYAEAEIQLTQSAGQGIASAELALGIGKLFERFPGNADAESHF